MEPGTSGVHGAAALAVGLEGWVPDRGHATLQDTEGRTCVWDLMRRLGKPAMSRKPVVLAQWTLLELTEIRWTMLTLLGLPWIYGVTTSHPVHRSLSDSIPMTNDPHNHIVIFAFCLTTDQACADHPKCRHFRFTGICSGYVSSVKLHDFK